MYSITGVFLSVILVDTIASAANTPRDNRWGILGNYPVFTTLMVIYHYVEKIWRISVAPDFPYNIYDHEKILSR